MLGALRLQFLFSRVYEAVVCYQVIKHDSDNVAEFSFQCCPAVLTSSSFPRSSPCFILAGNDVVAAVRYLAALARLLSLLLGPALLLQLSSLFGPALLLQLSSLSGGGRRVHYVVPLTDELCKSIYVRKVRVDGTSKQRGHDPDLDRRQGRHDTSGQFARFRQLVRNIPSEEIVDVSNIYVYA